MKDRAEVEKVRQQILPILRRNHVVRAGLFGSFARDEDRPGSDVDLLIDFGESRKTLFDLVHLQEELELSLGRKVDIAFYDGLKPRVRERALAEEISIL